ncbi:MAG: 3'-5' exonuclease, partial [Rubricoccaceae bacterium]|nr:3'-5' exonuclease [Rubricoccaceae bacterium]
FPEPSGDDLEAWKEMAELLQTQKGAWRKSVNKNHGFPATDTGRAMKARLSDVIASLSEIDGLERALAAVPALPEVRYSPDQWRILLVLFDLLERAAVHLKAVFGLRGVLDHQEVQERALAALGEELVPTDLAERLDYRIQHILVDEFQDTSRGQFDLLERLVEGWVPGDGRTLFLVGDPMQSIYRFREAEVALFLKAEQDGINELPLESLTLRRNFRSREEIVRWANGAFPAVLPPKSDAARGAVSYSFSEATRDEGGSVRVHPQYKNDVEGEAKLVVELVRARLEELQDSDGNVAILVRSRRHVAAIVPALREAGIQFRGKDLEKLGERQEVQDLLSLTRALLHPGDRTAWLGLLRTPWCGLSLADLTALLSEHPYRTVPNLIADDQHVDGLSADGQARLRRIRAILDTAWKNRRRRSLARWIEGVWLALGGPASLNSSVAMESARAYFELLEDLETGGDIVDFAELEEGMSSIFAPPDPSEGIRVELMTMHSAKGLEFDTVIIPGLGRRPARDSQQLLMWLEHPVRGENQLLMGPIRRAFDADQDPTYDFVLKLDKEHDDYENGRLLYVAATRAREHLHLLGHADFKPEKNEPLKPPSNTLLEKLWPAVSDVFDRNIPDPDMVTSDDEPESSTQQSQSYRRFHADLRLPPPPRVVPLPERSRPIRDQKMEEFAEYGDSSARHVGTIVHRILMRISRDGISTWQGTRIRNRRPLWEKLLIEKGIARNDSAELADRVVDALERTLADERGHWILGVHDEARSEYDVTGHLGGDTRRYFVDRTFIENGVRWIIDFKTGSSRDESINTFLEREQDRYREQLEDYARLFTNEGLPIRLGLYFPMEAAWIEWEFESTPG